MLISPAVQWVARVLALYSVCVGLWTHDYVFIGFVCLLIIYLEWIYARYRT